MTTLQGGALYVYLQSVPPLVALVADRVYPSRMPTGPVFPLVVYHRISTSGRELSHSGPDGLAVPRIQLDVWAQDPDTADAVAEELRIALHGHRGAMGDLEVGSVQIANDLDADEAETGLFRRILDALITHEEAVA